MKKFPFFYFFVFIALLLFNLRSTEAFSPALMPSTEADPDAFVCDCVNVINGDYCECVTDLILQGPDPLALQRFYNATDYATGTRSGGWRILPQSILIIGSEIGKKPITINDSRYDWTYAIVGERSGGYSVLGNWRKEDGTSNETFTLDVVKNGIGSVNTYSEEINGQTNHKNTRLTINEDCCEVLLGDGTKRNYQKTSKPPISILGGDSIKQFASKLNEPSYFQLIAEVLPSGNVIEYLYDEQGNIISIILKNALKDLDLSWIKFSYMFENDTITVNITTSEAKSLEYTLNKMCVEDGNTVFALMKVTGTHQQPIHYGYKIHGKFCQLVHKLQYNGEYEIHYDDLERVCTLKEPSAISTKPEIVYAFSYEDGLTEVFEPNNTKTCYRYDKRRQLTAIEKYDVKSKLWRTDKKYWGKGKDTGCLIAKTISDGSGNTLSYRSFKYDDFGNIVEERLYGNLTGKTETYLQLSEKGEIVNPNEEECHVKTYQYSKDEFNLLTIFGDCKGGRTEFFYKPGTNLLTKKLIYKKDGSNNATISMREFNEYDRNAVQISKIKDDGTSFNDKDQLGCERHVTKIQPRQIAPFVGYPENIEEWIVEKIYSTKDKPNEIIIKKTINTFSSQGYLETSECFAGNGQLLSTKKYNSFGQLTAENIAGKSKEYEYDTFGNLEKEIFTDQGKFIQYSYNLKKQIVAAVESGSDNTSTLQNSYDRLGRKLSSIDQFGHATNYEYDEFGMLTKIVFPQVLNENEQLVTPTFSYTHDLFGNIITITDPKDYITQKCYNLKGDTTKIFHPDGSKELFMYDPEGSLHRWMTRDQVVHIYEYDYLGRTTKELIYDFDKPKAHLKKTIFFEYSGFHCVQENTSGYNAKHTFDGFGRVKTIVEGSGNEVDNHKTEFSYDALGRISSKKIWHDKGAQDFSTEYLKYDLAGNITEKRVEDHAGIVLLRKTFAYNVEGQCTEEFEFQNDEPQTIIEKEYNSCGDLTCYRDALGNESRVLYDYNHFNSLNQSVLKKTIINPLGLKTELEMDTLGRLVRISEIDQMGVLQSSQKIIYDACGNKNWEITEIIVEGNNVGTKKMRWKYGPMNRLEEKVEAVDSSNEKHTTYGYNAFGQITSKLLPECTNPITYQYDKFGRLAKVEYTDLQKTLISNTFSYDSDDRIVDANTKDCVYVHRTFDQFGNMGKEEIKTNDIKTSVSIEHDKKNRIKKVTLPDSSTIDYVYDAEFCRKISRKTSNGKTVSTHHYKSYDQVGRVLEETLIGYAGNRKTEYDGTGKKKSVQTDFFIQNATYDLIGNVTSVSSNGEIKEYNAHYSYNSLSQLISEDKPHLKTYVYDSLDNRFKEDNDAITNNALNQIVSSSNAEYSYDAQGNLLKKVLDGEETKFESNILSQILSVKKSDETSFQYIYDAFGRRISKSAFITKNKKSEQVSKSNYFYFGLMEIGSINSKIEIQELKIPGMSGNKISESSIAFEIRNKLYLPLHDILGNVVCLLDPTTRDVLEKYEYTAFGIETIFNSEGEILTTSEYKNPWRYAEKRTDEETGLIYFGLRYYDPQIGRWITPDPLGYLDGPNVYAYLHNNPLTYLDRFGLATESKQQNTDEQFYGDFGRICPCDVYRTCKRSGDLNKTVSQLPKVYFCDYFEYLFPVYNNHSEFYTLGHPEVDDIFIGFIPGIWNNLPQTIESAKYISDLAGGYNVHFVYNATHGPFVDPIECAMGLLNIATTPVRQLHRMWNYFVSKSSPNAKMLMICHSQGAIHVRNALLSYPPHLWERILVVAIAPGGYIYRMTCDDVFHYRAEALRDYIPLFDKEGVMRERKTTTVLKSHPQAPLHDHTIFSPTFRPPLLHHMQRYIYSGGEHL